MDADEKHRKEVADRRREDKKKGIGASGREPWKRPRGHFRVGKDMVLPDEFLQSLWAERELLDAQMVEWEDEYKSMRGTKSKRATNRRKEIREDLAASKGRMGQIALEEEAYLPGMVKRAHQTRGIRVRSGGFDAQLANRLTTTTTGLMGLTAMLAVVGIAVGMALGVAIEKVSEYIKEIKEAEKAQRSFASVMMESSFDIDEAGRSLGNVSIGGGQPSGGGLGTSGLSDSATVLANAMIYADELREHFTKKQVIEINKLHHDMKVQGSIFGEEGIEKAAYIAHLMEEYGKGDEAQSGATAYELLGGLEKERAAEILDEQSISTKGLKLSKNGVENAQIVAAKIIEAMLNREVSARGRALGGLIGATGHITDPSRGSPIVGTHIMERLDYGMQGLPRTMRAAEGDKERAEVLTAMQSMAAAAAYWATKQARAGSPIDSEEAIRINEANRILQELDNVIIYGGSRTEILGEIEDKWSTPRAKGGTVGKGEITLVGEQGPEIAVFPDGTQIIPNAEISDWLGSGGMNGTISVRLDAISYNRGLDQIVRNTKSSLGELDNTMYSGMSGVERTFRSSINEMGYYAGEEFPDKLGSPRGSQTVTPIVNPPTIEWPSFDGAFTKVNEFIDKISNFPPVAGAVDRVNSLIEQFSLFKESVVVQGAMDKFNKMLNAFSSFKDSEYVTWIKDKFNNAVSSISGIFDGPVVEKAKNLFNSAVGILKNISESEIVTSAVNKFNLAVSFLKNVFSKETVEEMIEKFNNGVLGLYNITKDTVIEPIINAFNASISWLGTLVGDSFVKSSVEKVNSVIKLLNLLPGVDIPNIPTPGQDKQEDKPYHDWESFEPDLLPEDGGFVSKIWGGTKDIGGRVIEGIGGIGGQIYTQGTFTTQGSGGFGGSYMPFGALPGWEHAGTPIGQPQEGPREGETREGYGVGSAFDTFMKGKVMDMSKAQRNEFIAMGFRVADERARSNDKQKYLPELEKIFERWGQIPDIAGAVVQALRQVINHTAASNKTGYLDMTDADGVRQWFKNAESGKSGWRWLIQNQNITTAMTEVDDDLDTRAIEEQRRRKQIAEDRLNERQEDLDVIDSWLLNFHSSSLPKPNILSEVSTGSQAVTTQTTQPQVKQLTPAEIAVIARTEVDAQGDAMIPFGNIPSMKFVGGNTGIPSHFKTDFEGNISRGDARQGANWLFAMRAMNADSIDWGNWKDPTVQALTFSKALATPEMLRLAEAMHALADLDVAFQAHMGLGKRQKDFPLEDFKRMRELEGEIADLEGIVSEQEREMLSMQEVNRLYLGMDNEIGSLKDVIITQADRQAALAQVGLDADAVAAAEAANSSLKETEAIQKVEAAVREGTNEVIKVRARIDYTASEKYKQEKGILGNVSDKVFEEHTRDDRFREKYGMVGGELPSGVYDTILERAYEGSGSALSDLNYYREKYTGHGAFKITERKAQDYFLRKSGEMGRPHSKLSNEKLSQFYRLYGTEEQREGMDKHSAQYFVDKSGRLTRNPNYIKDYELKLAGRMAEGGRVGQSGLYLVGEQGPELVTLNAGSFVVNNNELNSSLHNPRESGPREIHITLEVGGNELGKIVVDALSEQIRHRDPSLGVF